MEVNPVSQQRAEGAQQPRSRSDSAERYETFPASLPDFRSPLLIENWAPQKTSRYEKGSNWRLAGVLVGAAIRDRDSSGSRSSSLLS